jgi:hypothetical protein
MVGLDALGAITRIDLIEIEDGRMIPAEAVATYK